MDGALTLFPETFDLATGLYTMIHVVSHSSELSNSRTALTTPPLHVHRYQTEIFNVVASPLASPLQNPYQRLTVS